MKRNHLPILALLSAILGAIALAGLRYYQLAFCMDENGLLARGSRIPWVFLAVVVVVIAALVLSIVRLDKAAGTEQDCHRCIFWHLCSAAAAAVFMAGCGYYALKVPTADTLKLVLYFAGLVCGALLIISDALRIMGKSSHLVLLLLPCLFLAGKLVFDFKQWSYDPIVIDFCFKLLASITAMLACFNLAGFPIGIGRKRATIFFCLLAFVFSVMTIPDCLLKSGCSFKDLAIYVSLGLWCLINGLMLLFPREKAEELPAEAEQEKNEEENDPSLL